MTLFYLSSSLLSSSFYFICKYFYLISSSSSSYSCFSFFIFLFLLSLLILQANIQKEECKKTAVHVEENVAAPSPRCNCTVCVREIVIVIERLVLLPWSKTRYV